MINRVFIKLIHPFLKTYWFIFRPRTRGVKCVIQNGGKILLIRNSYGNKLWTFPGGGVDEEETMEQAVEREVMEEVGIKINELKRIGEFATTAEYKIDTVTVFVAKSTHDQFKIDEKEILEAGWFFPENLPTISEHAKKIISMWASQGYGL
ncbi:MAG: hypothetical protein COZ49_02110 [Candidatus Yonathbacteria bacterium CG_4_10_14_3_um_filter_47_65]|uniref:Nudix hydrolase domain-containing protein n=2 Tax=Parcubacteria group TaxID=1794811 RepID=A0A2M8D7S1_9BACT|nr:MAG: hypothetical protein AUJ44_01240 [Candidatus Nomurabacteria bacterium CG1_02_47_685]PIP03348.1 MAG: hypothetical protein COX54_04020 [Candidatus Yonathbacteria bacterium CG23_combo_of_CG06-09_8_20_14_all_46_18]PIQ32502.1 MAG: hypothetical protein COW61_01590 [Candidatus Yonathbacteria bacterium CG17_big_fil_post_rev_8_21_14_2_50_46_19]PIX56439.1 MAG: hypothetical protein COZ49_02110 [Candidatus Yonathbacteria bacterium CG_4_10_14_3_um_filter_47_65]PJB83188.1 MAG: hypothetical protein CO